MRTIIATAAAALLLTGCATAAPAPDTYTPKPLDKQPVTPVELYVIPHEDDEFELWSQVEGEPDTYKVFVVLGAGEQTAFCAPFPNAGYQAGLEAAPVPAPPGQWTPECTSARLASWLQFFGHMSAADPTIPGSFPAEAQVTVPDPAGVVCRQDREVACASTDNTARVWVDDQGRGSLVAFNIGEGDETVPEIEWAIRGVLDNPAAFGIPADGKVESIVGAYSNLANPDCFIYPNVDHRAVHEALWNVDFGVPVQMAATCGTDADATHTAQVSDAAMVAAWGTPDNERAGAHPWFYGWLHQTYYPLSRDDQSHLFHGPQAFWVR